MGKTYVKIESRLITMYGIMNYYKIYAKITEDDINRVEGAESSEVRIPASRVLCRDALTEIYELANPQVLCEVAPIKHIVGHEVCLDKDVVLTSPLLVRLSAAAESMFLCLCTLGSGIDERIDYYYSKGSHAKAYYLDLAGTALIGAVSRKIANNTKKQLQALGLNTTISLEPGHSYWPDLLQQRLIYDMLKASAIGVKILDSGVILPKKSLTLVMGIGKNIPENTKNHCHYCKARDNCNLSRAKNCS